jgi:hypothetical protein
MKQTYKHYYFKFGEGNTLFKDYLKKYDEESSKTGFQFPLSIFFNRYKDKNKKDENPQWDWTVENFYNDKNKLFANRHQNDIKQIEDFFECGKYENIANTVFWIFDEIKVYALQPISKICNGKSDEILKKYRPKIEDGETAKTILCKLVKQFSKDKLPESFATINANQAYNRKTIVPFKEKEQEIANFLFNRRGNEKMEIKESKILNYLSPIQFETLIFLIFHHNKIFCSTYRGGTLKEVDLKITVDENSTLEYFKEYDDQYIQIKMGNYSKKINYILIHLGQNDYEKKKFGKDWITEQIEKLPEVKNWLIKSLDFYKIIN